MVILICFQVTADGYYREGIREGLGTLYICIPDLNLQYAKKI